MKIYVVRHGETNVNLENRVSNNHGKGDNSVTERFSATVYYKKNNNS